MNGLRIMDNEYIELKNMIEELKNKDKKPTLLLHSCCGPCSSHVLFMLKDAFDISILYYNPNIYPSEEYEKRLMYQIKIRDVVDPNIKIIPIRESYNKYLEATSGDEHLKEGSKRCYDCYEFRLKYLAEYASSHNFDYYTSVMSVSPYKNSEWINEILKKYEGKSKALYSNFKKDDGYKNTIKFSKEYGLYRQDYCGCEYSIKEHEERLNK